jgi:hypothetical protein
MLSRAEVEKEVGSAREFQPTLGRFLIATTAPRDSRLQEAVRLIDEAERAAGSFSVTVFFWEDIVSSLGLYPELLSKYYPQFYLDLPGSDQRNSVVFGEQRDDHATQLRGAGPRRSEPPSAQEFSKLEVVVDKCCELNYVGLLPAYSSDDPAQEADLSLLDAFFSLEIVNHDQHPTEIQRLWLAIGDSSPHGEIAPLDIKEEKFTGDPRIGARSRRHYDVHFTAVFEGTPQQDWRQRVVLRIKAIGLGELEVGLRGFFHERGSKNEHLRADRE